LSRHLTERRRSDPTASFLLESHTPLPQLRHVELWPGIVDHLARYAPTLGFQGTLDCRLLLIRQATRRRFLWRQSSDEWLRARERRPTVDKDTAPGLGLAGMHTEDPRRLLSTERYSHLGANELQPDYAQLAKESRPVL
jgi:hypothetical protein